MKRFGGSVAACSLLWLSLVQSSQSLSESKGVSPPVAECAMSGVSGKKKLVVLPGNGCANIMECNWYAWFCEVAKKEIKEYEIVCRDMPDPYVARESEWMPFVKDVIKVDENTVVVGHSSGAICAMRLLEDTKIHGAVLVAPCYTDLGLEQEKLAGWYARPWLWEKIKANAGFIVQFHSVDDPICPIHEGRHIAQKLSGPNHKYIEMQGKSHYFEPFQELIDELKAKIL